MYFLLPPLPSNLTPLQCATPSGSSIPRYQTMSTALLASGRPIYYSICNWGVDSVWTWGNTTGNSWRVSSDVSDSWGSVAQIAAGNTWLAPYAAPGGFNDFDMLEVGNGGLTAQEERTHFALWAISKSPLLIGTDLSKISQASLAVLLNSVSLDPFLAQISLAFRALLLAPSSFLPLPSHPQATLRPSH